ncbi:unnamed protein product, partial [Prorocentrum cordatum]
ERRQLETAMALSRSQGALLPGWPASGLPQDGGEEAQVRRAQSQSLREAWRAQLPVSVVPTRSAQEARECPLCIGALAPGDRVLHLDCLHSFHEESASSRGSRSTRAAPCASWSSSSPRVV